MAEQDRTRWTKLVADFESSDLTQREFATERGISVSAARTPSGGRAVTGTDSARGRDLPASGDDGRPISPPPLAPARGSAAAAGR